MDTDYPDELCICVRVPFIWSCIAPIYDRVCVLPTSVVLGHADGLLPLVVGPVHVDGAQPLARLGIVVLGLAEVALELELLRQILVGLLEQLLAVRGHQADHGLVLARLLVHVDGQVGLLDRHVQLLGLLELALRLELLRLVDVQQAHLALAHVRHGELVRHLPAVGPRVHLHRQLGVIGRTVAPLRLLQLLGLLVVAAQLAVVRLGGVLVQRHDQLHGTRPLARVHGRLDRLGVRVRLDVVVDRHVHLAKRHT